MKKIDLSKVLCKMVDGSKKEFDLREGLSSAIYQTQHPGQAAFAMEVWKNPIVELTDEKKEYIRNGLRDGKFFFYIVEAVEKLLND